VEQLIAASPDNRGSKNNRFPKAAFLASTFIGCTGPKSAADAGDTKITTAMSQAILDQIFLFITGTSKKNYGPVMDECAATSWGAHIECLARSPSISASSFVGRGTPPPPEFELLNVISTEQVDIVDLGQFRRTKRTDLANKSH
jgi:hypothetical protein